MKKIIIYKTKALLESLKADETTIELILNNISQYNSLVLQIQKGEHLNQYLAYQLNVAITKQIDNCKKVCNKLNDDNIDDDGFKAVVDAVKKSKEKPITGFVYNKDRDTEKR
jgi:precorrin-4 methylase